MNPIQVGTSILYETIEEIFWSVYRKDTDLLTLRQPLETILGLEIVDILFPTIEFYADLFRNLQNSTEEEDKSFISKSVNEIMVAMQKLFPNLIELFFE